MNQNLTSEWLTLSVLFSFLTAFSWGFLTNLIISVGEASSVVLGHVDSKFSASLSVLCSAVLMRCVLGLTVSVFSNNVGFSVVISSRFPSRESFATVTAAVSPVATSLIRESWIKVRWKQYCHTFSAPRTRAGLNDIQVWPHEPGQVCPHDVGRECRSTDSLCSYWSNCWPQCRSWPVNRIYKDNNKFTCTCVRKSEPLANALAVVLSLITVVPGSVTTSKDICVSVLWSLSKSTGSLIVELSFIWKYQKKLRMNSKLRRINWITKWMMLSPIAWKREKHRTKTEVNLPCFCVDQAIGPGHLERLPRK